MKDFHNHKFWIRKASYELNATELAVFWMWFSDLPAFCARTNLLHKRLPHISPANIRKATRGLIAKGFIRLKGTIKNKYGTASHIHELVPLTESRWSIEFLQWSQDERERSAWKAVENTNTGGSVQT